MATRKPSTRTDGAADQERRIDELTVTVAALARRLTKLEAWVDDLDAENHEHFRAKW
jgi:uncharacterized coiled-coil protein SlyX